MKPVYKDFIRKETKIQFLLWLFILLCCSIIIFLGELSKVFYIAPFLLLVFLLFKTHIMALQQCKLLCYELTEREETAIGEEYLQHHMVFPLSSGEAHFLSHYVIYRFRRSLYMIPYKEMESIEVLSERLSQFGGSMLLLSIQTIYGKKFTMGFFTKKQKNNIPAIQSLLLQKNPDINRFY